jgi:hypothetical protein
MQFVFPGCIPTSITATLFFFCAALPAARQFFQRPFAGTSNTILTCLPHCRLIVGTIWLMM